MLTIKNRQLYANGELVTRGNDDSYSVEPPVDEHDAAAVSVLDWHPVSDTRGVVAYFADEADACLFAQVMEFIKLRCGG